MSGRNAPPPLSALLVEIPPLFVRLNEASSVRRATVLLREASDEEVAACEACPFGVIGLLVTKAGARAPERSKARGSISAAHVALEDELLDAVRLGLRRGLSADRRFQSAGPTYWPPVVAAARYDFARVLGELLAAGADPLMRASDRNNAAHAALLRPSALARLLQLEPAAVRRALVDAQDSAGLTPLVSCLAPMKGLPAATRQLLDQAALLLLGAGASISDCDFDVLRRRRKEDAIIRLVQRTHAWPPGEPLPPLHRGPLGCIAAQRKKEQLGLAARWSTAWHWSFPQSDRHAIRSTCLLARRGHSALPEEVWRLVFEHCRRGWFAVRGSNV